MGTPGECNDEKARQIEELSKDVLKEYDELSKKHEQIKEENESLKQQLIDKDKTLQDAKNLIEPAIQQYERLKNKYNIEKECRDKAQTYASKIYHHNTKLKRQSMDLIGLLDRQQIPITELKLDLDEEDELEEEVRGSYDNVLTQEIKDFRNQLSGLQVQLQECQCDLQTERDNHQWAQEKFKNTKVQLKQTEAQLDEYKKQLKEFTQDAEENYMNLQELFQEEQARRDIAEKKMAELAVSENQMKRQSNALMLKVTPGEQLHQALMEIEDLTQMLEQQRTFYDGQIQNLKEQFGTSNKEETDELETEINTIKTERESLLKRLEEYDEKYSTLEKQYTELQDKYEILKCPPPPPPPPPPPVFVPNKNAGFLKKKKKKDIAATLSKSGAAPTPDFSKALDEMMSNIKKGRTLRPTLKMVKKETDDENNATSQTILKSRSLDIEERDQSEPSHSPMSELQDIMSKMKRSQSVGDGSSPHMSNVDSELARTFMKVRNKSVDSDIPLMPPGKLAQVAEEGESEVTDENDGTASTRL